MVISNRSWLLLRSVARSHRCFWVWPLPGFLALMSWCLHYFDYAHFVTNSFDKCINDVMTMTSDLSWMWKHFHCNPDSRKITSFRKVAIGIRRKTPQIIERGEDLVASFDENLRPGRTYQVPHRTHMSNGHCPALFCLVSKSEDDDGDPCNSLTMSQLQVVVKTVSGSVASWPATGNVTTKPLPVSFICIFICWQWWSAIVILMDVCSHFDGRK